ncbi:hypothetical protein L208DRAFT_1381130 [Tricholoma matsutake]|nr:hypothetical protein L208DRAFT_1381130 [Tricholoma matsutake 945]
MSNTNPRLYSYSYDTLLNQLNVLLRALQLPILLQSPTDLTPSLLIAIMESLLSKRIPLEFSPSRNRSKTNVHSMKIFLGVLESDILKMDVGLSTVDPRRKLGLMESCDEDDELQYAVEKHEVFTDKILTTWSIPAFPPTLYT